jgi:hypothetical protein
MATVTDEDVARELADPVEAEHHRVMAWFDVPGADAFLDQAGEFKPPDGWPADVAPGAYVRRALEQGAAERERLRTEDSLASALPAAPQVAAASVPPPAPASPAPAPTPKLRLWADYLANPSIEEK